MDRLICGVGFGKTGSRCAPPFAAALNGNRSPSSCRRRCSLPAFQTFTQRFAGLPVRIAQLSAWCRRRPRRGRRRGGGEEIDIVVGTHAVLGKTVSFQDLGLVVIDEGSISASATRSG